MRKYRKDEVCWCGSGKMYGECHMEFDKKIMMFKKRFNEICKSIGNTSFRILKRNFFSKRKFTFCASISMNRNI